MSRVNNLKPSVFAAPSLCIRTQSMFKKSRNLSEHRYNDGIAKLFICL